eukprot:1159163-Pelagomonas_calceolata.AAC.12
MATAAAVAAAAAAMAGRAVGGQAAERVLQVRHPWAWLPTEVAEVAEGKDLQSKRPRASLGQADLGFGCAKEDGARNGCEMYNVWTMLCPTHSVCKKNCAANIKLQMHKRSTCTLVPPPRPHSLCCAADGGSSCAG